MGFSVRIGLARYCSRIFLCGIFIILILACTTCETYFLTVVAFNSCLGTSKWDIFHFIGGFFSNVTHYRLIDILGTPLCSTIRISSFSALWRAFKSFVINIGTAIKRGFVYVVTSIKNGVRSIVTGIKNGVIYVVTSIKNGISYIVTSIKNLILATFNGIKNSIRATINFVKNVITRTGQW